MPVPTCQAYDPAFAGELAVIIEDGIKRMYGDQENIFYYLTLMNEQYEHPPMPDGARDGILKGMYLFKPTSLKDASCACSSLAAARSLSRRSRRRRSSRRGSALARTCGVSRATPISIAMVMPASAGIGSTLAISRACPYVTQVTANAPGPFIAASDYLKVLPDSIDRWLPRPDPVARHRRLRSV